MSTKEDFTCIDLFNDLDKDQLEQLEERVLVSSYPAGHVFYKPGKVDNHLFFLIEGRVQLFCISPTGKKLLLLNLTPGSFFGEMSLIGDGRQNTHAAAVLPSRVCVMDRSEIQQLILNQPQVAYSLLGAMGYRMNQLELKLEGFLFKNVPARLADLLLDTAREQGSQSKVIGLSHQDLGDMIGSYRETITQTLTNFKSEGLVEVGRRQITLLDPQSLELVANS